MECAAYRHPTTFDKNAALETEPHYSDHRFKKERTVFGEAVEGLHYDYSDRIWEWDRDKAKAAAKKANNSGADPRTCRWYEAYLSSFFEKPVEISHIVSGVNHSNGYPYCIFGYRYGEEVQ